MVYKSRWLDRVLPGTCILCGAPSGQARDLCAPCSIDLPWNDACCPRCAMPLPPGPAMSCGRCLVDPPGFAACVAALRYEYPVRELIMRFKFDADLASGRMLAQLLAARIRLAGAPAPGELALVPVPLHPARQADRGFNQAERIARVLGRELCQKLHHGLVERVFQTPDQKQLGASARRANLHGAFRAQHCAGLRVALVDDVITTGATANAVSAALIRAGAQDVRIWCLARAI